MPFKPLSRDKLKAILKTHEAIVLFEAMMTAVGEEMPELIEVLNFAIDALSSQPSQDPFPVTQDLFQAFAVLPPPISDHRALSGVVVNEHINHAAVTLTAGNGLTGGGDITASRTFDVGAGTGISVAANSVAVNQGTAFDFSNFITFSWSSAGAAAINVQSASPRQWFINTGGAAGEKIWEIGMSSGSLYAATLTDVGGAGTTVANFARSGTTPTTLSITYPTVSLAGNLQLAAVGNKHLIKEGSNASMGAATLVAGTVVVNNTLVTASSRIMLSGQNSSGTHGELTISARTASTSFTITSSNAADTRAVAWLILEPAP